MDLQRYKQDVDFEEFPVGSPLPNDEGEWVRYKDVAALLDSQKTSALPKSKVPFTKDTLVGDFHGYRREIWSHAARSMKLGHGGNDGCQLMFMMTNGKKAIVFGVFTGWYHPQVVAEQQENRLPNPEGGVVDYHYWVDAPGDCTIIDGGGCRSENDYTNGEKLFEALCEGGFDAVWQGMYELIENDEEEE